MRDLKKVTRGHEQALHAGGGARSCAAPSCRSCSPGRRATSSSRSRYARAARRRSRQRPHRRDPGREAPSCRSISRSASREEIAGFVGAPESTESEQAFPKFAKCRFFVRPGGESSPTPYQEDGELVAKQIFDQARPKSTMAQQLDEAFAGCDQWTARAAASAAQQPRLQPPRLELLEDDRQGGGGADPGARRAVVVGVVQEQDVPGPDAGGRLAGDRGRASPARSSPSPTATTAPAASRGRGSRAGRRR